MDGGSADARPPEANARAVFQPPIFARAVNSNHDVSTLSRAQDRQRGFTLLEILVAISIFALISAMAYSGLANVLRANEHIEKERAAWRELGLLYLRMEEDISQIRPRTIYDAYGVTRAALEARPANSRPLDDPDIAFTRGGIFLPKLDTTGTPQTSTQIKRPVRVDLQRVAYRLNERVLSRWTWSELDQAPQSRPQETVVLKDVMEFQLRYYVPKAGWVDNWPMPGANGLAPNLTDLPSGVEVRLVLKDRGEFKRLFLIHE